MNSLRLPELNSVMIVGNLTKDPIYRQTSSNILVANFILAINRRFKDSSNTWHEDVCFVGIVAWDKLAESCRDRLIKGSSVLIDGELQSKNWRREKGDFTSNIQIKAKRIQFLSKVNGNKATDEIFINFAEDELFSEESLINFQSENEEELENGKGIK